MRTPKQEIDKRYETRHKEERRQNIQGVYELKNKQLIENKKLYL